MKNKIAFVFDKGPKYRDLADLGMYPKHLLLGGYEMEMNNEAIIRDKDDVKSEDTLITNVPLYSVFNMPIFKRKILINLNSNHHFSKHRVKKYGIHLQYKMFSDIICLSSTQIKPLLENGISSNKIHVIPLGINDDVIKIAKKRALPGDYYITGGGYAGREFNFNISPEIKIIKFGEENKISYIEYCTHLCSSKGMVLKINNNEKSSDLSGSVTLLEALCAEKPVFINPQPWLKDYPNPNIYVYKNDKELNDLLLKNIKWIPCDTSYLKIDRYLQDIRKVIYNNQ